MIITYNIFITSFLLIYPNEYYHCRYENILLNIIFDILFSFLLLLQIWSKKYMKIY